MYIMTHNGWQPLYEPLPTWAIIGVARSDEKRKGDRFTFEYFNGHKEAAIARAAMLSRTTGCDVKVYST